MGAEMQDVFQPLVKAHAASVARGPQDESTREAKTLKLEHGRCWSPAPALHSSQSSQPNRRGGRANQERAESRHAASHQGTCTPGPTTGDSYQGLTTGRNVDPLHPARPSQHLCVRTPAQNFAGADGSGVGERQKPRMANGSRKAVEQGFQGQPRSGDSFSAGSVGKSGSMPDRLDHAGEALRIRRATDDRNSAAQRQPQTVTSSSRDYSEIHQQIFQLKLLNSACVCYLNFTVISWLHAFSCTYCMEREIFGSKKVQAWRDVLYSTRPTHAHMWTPLHRGDQS